MAVEGPRFACDAFTTLEELLIDHSIEDVLRVAAAEASVRAEEDEARAAALAPTEPPKGEPRR